MASLPAEKTSGVFSDYSLAGKGLPTSFPAQRSTGLPPKITWLFNFDAGWGTFGFANSLYDNPREGVNEALSDQWFEGFVKPALSGAHTFASTSQLYGKVGAVGARTYGSSPPVFGFDSSSFGVDEAHIGWRSGRSIGSHENLLDVTVGRAEYALGHGMLLHDGAADGGSRGAYWSNARKAFAFAAIGRVRPGPHLAEVFYLDKDDLPERETGTRLWGANYEFAMGEDTTLGASYMRFFADPGVLPARDGLHVFNVRVYAAPLPQAPDLSIELEYASERNGEARHSNAWNGKAAYRFSSSGWTPELSYRYAWFQGDDPDTAVDEAFDPLLAGFDDWGTWWQGEIAGEYFLANSNLVSHQVRVHVDPREWIAGGLIAYAFQADQPRAFGPGVTSRNIAFELDMYVDWILNSNVTVSFVGAFADPGAAVQQATGRTKNFAYGMVYVGYSF